MFLSSFEKLRSFVFAGYDFVSLIDFGTELFDGKVGHNPIVAWVNRKSHTDYAMTGIRLVDYCYSRRDEKEPEFFNKRNYHYPKQSNFSKIPGSPVAYWVSDAMTSAFNNKKLSEILSPKQGTSTGNNDLFLRLWHEVSVNKISTCHTKASNTFEQKWYPATKGGDYRKWYGNNEYIVNWQYNGLEIKNYSGSAVRNPKANFHEALTWTGISSKTLGIRYCPEGFVFLISGKGIVGDSSLLKYVLGVCCSNVANELLKITSPTMSFEVGYIAGIPIAYGTIDIQTQVINLVNDNILLSRKDWDSYETSWDFKRNPLV